jgi:hypothetical protein
LTGEIDWATESDTAAICYKPVLFRPAAIDMLDVREHRLRPTIAIGEAGLAIDHFIMAETRNGEFGSADIEAKSMHLFIILTLIFGALRVRDLVLASTTLFESRDGVILWQPATIDEQQNDENNKDQA